MARTSSSYSERFVLTSASNAWTDYTVPVGMRAVIKCVTHVNNTTSEFLMLVRAAQFLVLSRLVPGATSVILPDLHITVYGGEAMGVFMYTPNGGACLSGFMFKDDSGRRGPPLSAGTHPILPAPDPGMGPTPIDAPGSSPRAAR